MAQACRGEVGGMTLENLMCSGGGEQALENKECCRGREGVGGECVREVQGQEGGVRTVVAAFCS